MARIKISQFPENLAPNLSGFTHYVEEGVNYKTTLDTLKTVLVASGSNGTSGTSGTSGANGTSGTSGMDGTSGTSGYSGTHGTSGSSGSSGESWSMVNVTYSELVDLVTASGITPTTTYRLTDYQTVHYMLDGRTRTNDINIGEIEVLYLTANSTCSFEPDAYSENYPNDIIRYDWNPNNWIKDLGFANAEAITGSGITINISGVTIIPGFKGVIYMREDTKNSNILGYDFRNVKFRRWKLDYPEWTSGDTYNIRDIVQVAGDGAYISKSDGNLNNSLTDTIHWNKLIEYTTTPYFGVSSLTSPNSSDYIDILTFAQVGITVESLYDLFVKNNLFECIKDTYDQRNGQIGSILSNNVFYLNDDYTNSMFDNLFDVFFELNTIDSNYNTNDVRHGFHSNIIGKNCTSNTMGHYFNSNIIFNNFFDNDISGYFQFNYITKDFTYNFISDYFADNAIGNTCSGNTIANNFESNNAKDNFKRNQISPDFINNTLGVNYIENVIINFFQSNTVLDNCVRNRIGNCAGNTIGEFFVSNYIDDTFFSNVIGSNFRSNKISNFFSGNTIGDNFRTNIAQSNFIGNVVSDGFSGNSIGSLCKLNTIGSGFTTNTIGESFISNTIGDEFKGNSIDAQFKNNAIGDSFKYNSIGGDFQLNTIQDYCVGNEISSRFWNNNIEDYFSVNCVAINVSNLNIPTYGAVSGLTFTLNDIKCGFDGTGIDFSSATHAYNPYNCEFVKSSTGTYKLKYVDGIDDNIIITNVNS